MVARHHVLHSLCCAHSGKKPFSPLYALATVTRQHMLPCLAKKLCPKPHTAVEEKSQKKESRGLSKRSSLKESSTKWSRHRSVWLLGPRLDAPPQEYHKDYSRRHLVWAPPDASWMKSAALDLKQ